MQSNTKPPVVSAGQWQQARDELMAAEKEATRALDALAAQRRRLPMVKFAGDYLFDTPTGPRNLLDLFENRPQLAVYQFMDNGPDDYCPGCTAFVNNIPAIGPERLALRGVTWMTVSDMPLAQIERYKAKMGWTVPFVSSRGSSFSSDCHVGEGFRLTMFLRDADEVYLTYYTTSRGVDRLLWVHNVLDLAAYGRQESWESSPAGWPQPF